MADRKASVALELQAGQFKAEAAAAGRSVDSLDRDVEKLDRDLNKIPADAAKAAAGLAAMGGAAKEVGKNVGTAGDETGKFDKRIGELKASTKSLAEEFNRTGDPALLKKFRADSSELAGITKMRKEISILGDEAKKFSQEAEKASMSVGDLFSGGLTSPASLGGLAAAAPLLLAAAGGLTALAAAGAVAGAGVAGAVAGDPQAFKAEWSAAIGSLKKDWTDASKPFTGPTMDAIRSVAPLVASWHIDTMFAKAATFVEPLVHGVEGFATGVERGVAAIVDKAGPAVAVFSADLPKIGDAVAQSLGMIADNAKGGAEALHALDFALESFIVGSGAIVSGAEAIVSGVTDAATAAKGFFDGIPGWVQVAIPPIAVYKQLFDQIPGTEDLAAAGGVAFGHALDGVTLSGADAASEISALQQSLSAAGNTMDAFVGGQVSGALNTMMSLDRATLGFNQSLLQVTESVKTNGHSLDEHTAKGAANVSVILSSVSANIQQYQSNIAAKMGAEQAAAAYDANTAALNKQLRSAGFTQGAIDGLIGKYKNVPDQVNTDIVLHGLTEAIQNLNTTLRLINGIHDRSATISVTTIYHQVGHPPTGEGGTIPLHGAYAHGGIRHASTGLIVGPSDPGTLIGEPQTGGEALIPLRGISQTRAMSLAQTVGNAYGFSVAPMGGGGYVDNRTVTYVINDASDPERVVSAIKRYEQRNGTDWRSSSRR